VPEQELGFSKDPKQARLKNSDRSGKPNTTFSWAPKRNILTWFDSPEAPLQKYRSTFLKFFFFAEKIDFYWAHLLNSQVLFQYLCEFCSECVENRRKEVKTDADTSEHFGEVGNWGEGMLMGFQRVLPKFREETVQACCSWTYFLFSNSARLCLFQIIV